MIQAEIGGAARVGAGMGAQRPGFMIRDFTLVSSRGESVRFSSFRGSSNLVVMFLGYSDAMRIFLEDVARHAGAFEEEDTIVVAVLPYGPEESKSATAKCSPLIVLHDKTHAVYRLSGATDDNGRLAPLVYLTDRFGEIAATYVAPGHSMPPSIQEILSALEFVNHQCPECEPPEWPR